MFRLITLTVFIILSALPVFAQATEPCNLKLPQAPALQRLKLGISFSKAGEILGGPLITSPVTTQAVFFKSGNDYVEPDGSPVTDEQRSEISTNQRRLLLGNVISAGPNPRPAWMRKNLDYMSFEFFQDSLESMTVRYRFETPIWNGLPEFIKNISEKDNLPLTAWQYAPTRPNAWPQASLNCSGFQMVVTGSPDTAYYQVDLKDTKARDELTKVTKQKWLEQKATEAKLKKDFAL
ncbi:MAG: hypothetical protein ABI878_05235 [Acidobacteriota bacterium]